MQQPKWKRSLDIVCCSVALPIFAFATLVVAIVMRFTSPGPIFFRQDRIGHKGRRFQIYKFRTMHVASDTGAHQAHAAQLMRSNAPMNKLDAQGDKRVIAGGTWIRASGLDELPQIINILRGEMSMVGPRPCIPYEYEGYGEAQRARFDSLPGLTGLWQVSGKNNTTFDEMIRLDVEYGRSKSLLLDLSIMLRTPGALLRQLLDILASRRQRRALAASATPLSVPCAPNSPPHHS